MATLKTQKQIEIEKEEERQRRKIQRQAEKVELLALQEELQNAIESKSKKYNFDDYANKVELIQKVISLNKSDNYTEEYQYYYLLGKYDKIANKVIRQRKQKAQEIKKAKIERKNQEGLSQETLNKIHNDNGIKLKHKKMGNMSGYLLSLFFK